MGWDDAHLHQFTIEVQIYADDCVEDPWDGPPKEECPFRLDKMAPLGTRFRYEYDFGDGWEHDVVIEEVLPPERAVTYPRCLTGRRACSSEDRGGPRSCAGLLAAIADPEGSGACELLEWAGEHFDPEDFDPVTMLALFVPRSRRKS